MEYEIVRAADGEWFGWYRDIEDHPDDGPGARTMTRINAEAYGAAMTLKRFEGDAIETWHPDGRCEKV